MNRGGTGEPGWSIWYEQVCGSYDGVPKEKKILWVIAAIQRKLMKLLKEVSLPDNHTEPCWTVVSCIVYTAFVF